MSLSRLQPRLFPARQQFLSLVRRFAYLVEAALRNSVKPGSMCKVCGYCYTCMEVPTVITVLPSGTVLCGVCVQPGASERPDSPPSSSDESCPDDELLDPYDAPPRLDGGYVLRPRTYTRAWNHFDANGYTPARKERPPYEAKKMRTCNLCKREDIPEEEICEHVLRCDVPTDSDSSSDLCTDSDCYPESESDFESDSDSYFDSDSSSDHGRREKKPRCCNLCKRDDIPEEDLGEHVLHCDVPTDPSSDSDDDYASEYTSEESDA